MGSNKVGIFLERRITRTIKWCQYASKLEGSFWLLLLTDVVIDKSCDNSSILDPLMFSAPWEDLHIYWTEGSHLGNERAQLQFLFHLQNLTCPVACVSSPAMKFRTKSTLALQCKACEIDGQRVNTGAHADYLEIIIHRDVSCENS